MIYLFSSTSRERYLQDILDILALPHSSLYRFRYSDRWVDQDLLPKVSHSQEQYIQSLRNYQDDIALIVLVNEPKDKAQRTDDKIHLYPLRQGRIRRLELDGTVLHAFFELTNYVDWRELSVETCDRSIRSVLGVNKRPPQKDISVASKLPEQIVFVEPEYAGQAWESAVTAISGIEDYEYSVFYRVSGMREVKDPSWASKLLHVVRFAKQPLHGRKVPIERVSPTDTGYKLRSGRIYALDLSFFHPENLQEPIQGSKILPLVDPDYFAYKPGEIEVNFRYDKCVVELVTIPLNRDIYTRITIGRANLIAAGWSQSVPPRCHTNGARNVQTR